mgnify:CR=1 FL=1|tara:strand:+ start:91 stop:498 length:408 start_codon:yes stop_codon:yes gene_type:complete
MSNSFFVPNTPISGSSSSDYSVPGLSGIFSGGPEKKKKSRKDRYRDAVDAASKFKDTTDYKARKEAKENQAAQKATMKIADDISVMEGYQDPGFTIEGQKGTRGGILGGIGSAVGGYFGGPLGGQIGGMIGSSFG